MEMTDGQICREYKSAKNKRVQIRILADLNQTSQEVIIKILKENGLYGNPVKVPTKNISEAERRKKNRLMKLGIDELIKLHDEHYNQCRIIKECLELKTANG